MKSLARGAGFPTPLRLELFEDKLLVSPRAEDFTHRPAIGERDVPLLGSSPHDPIRHSFNAVGQVIERGPVAIHYDEHHIVVLWRSCRR